MNFNHNNSYTEIAEIVAIYALFGLRKVRCYLSGVHVTLSSNLIGIFSMIDNEPPVFFIVVLLLV